METTYLHYFSVFFLNKQNENNFFCNSILCHCRQQQNFFFKIFKKIGLRDPRDLDSEIDFLLFVLEETMFFCVLSFPRKHVFSLSKVNIQLLNFFDATPSIPNSLPPLVFFAFIFLPSSLS